mmetsp:Transcript_7852/g.24504  ORF Transcript_7852/g.24504 Transcript_7852/m.24504 type:complete len:145 (+) Transcript_7852:1224-1658(+)
MPSRALSETEIAVVEVVMPLVLVSTTRASDDETALAAGAESLDGIGHAVPAVLFILKGSFAVRRTRPMLGPVFATLSTIRIRLNLTEEDFLESIGCVLDVPFANASHTTGGVCSAGGVGEPKAGMWRRITYEPLPDRNSESTGC